MEWLLPTYAWIICAVCFPRRCLLLSDSSKLCFCRLLVEKIFAQYMVPHSLDTEEKMKCLYYLYACLDTNAVKLVKLVMFTLLCIN